MLAFIIYWWKRNRRPSKGFCRIKYFSIIKGRLLQYFLNLLIWLENFYHLR